MLWTTQKGKVTTITNGGIVGTATPGTAVVANATTLLDGAVTELIASGSNTQDSWGIRIDIWGTCAGGVAGQASMDFLIGGATDDILINQLLCGYCRNFGTGGGRHYFFPVHIPQGKRIAATHANVAISQSASVLVTLYGGADPPFRVGGKITTYGSPSNNARGVTTSPTASGGTASVTQMTASSTYDHFAFLPGFQAATDTSLTPDGGVNIGIGVGASTEQRIGTWYFGKNTTEDMSGPFPPMPAFCDVAAGQRLTILASNSGANDASYDSLIYAVG